jgi:hypothetical protein
VEFERHGRSRRSATAETWEVFFTGSTQISSDTWPSSVGRNCSALSGKHCPGQLASKLRNSTCPFFSSPERRADALCLPELKLADAGLIGAGPRVVSSQYL